MELNSSLPPLVTVFALIHGALTNDDSEEWSDTSRESNENIGRDKKFVNLDLRGNIRKSFGITAIQKDSDESSVCSPVAALLPLGKLVLGAKDFVLKEFYEAIGISVDHGEFDYAKQYDSNYKAVKPHLTKLLAELRNVTRPFLDVASRLYISENLTVYNIYEHQSESIFESAIHKVNFHDSNYLATTINEWVSSQTHETITEIISPANLTPQSSLVIVNAIYFTGTWNTSFIDPAPQKFHSLRGDKDVLTMHSNMWYKYAFNERLNAELVEIPYAEPNMSLLLVLPNERFAIVDLMKLLKEHPEYLAEAIEEMKLKYIFLTMPMFRIESQWDLNILYKGVGLKSMFQHGKSGLTEIVHERGLHVSTAVQKAVIDVHDKGKNLHLYEILNSEEDPISISADHPFLFVVRLRSQQLLVGKCC